jgi:hypothetical protein
LKFWPEYQFSRLIWSVASILASFTGSTICEVCFSIRLSYLFFMGVLVFNQYFETWAETNFGGFILKFTFSFCFTVLVWFGTAKKMGDVLQYCYPVQDVSTLPMPECSCIRLPRFHSLDEILQPRLKKLKIGILNFIIPRDRCSNMFSITNVAPVTTCGVWNSAMDNILSLKKRGCSR